MTVPRLRRHLEALPFEKEFQALANELVVVSEKDLNGHLQSPIDTPSCQGRIEIVAGGGRAARCAAIPHELGVAQHR